MPKQCFPKAVAKTTDIAVIGLSCCYPGASNARELWENILARRVQFRRIPHQRLALQDYYSEDSAVPDKTYITKAALIENFSFEWSRLRIPREMFVSADIAHWLALDSALKAFEDAGYKYSSTPNENAGVIVGNTLTGEQTRSQTLRLRWPFVQRVLNTTLARLGVSTGDRNRISSEMEKYYKSAFPPFAKDSLVGGLSNTIAGRICNYLNFKGGGYVVDGACSSSLLAIATAANALKMGELDLALAGGVDVSLDPFELVGFAKVGALGKDRMSVYDKEANGFLPGEGCGFVVLKRLEDALRDRNYVYAVIKGWGVSSDGKGGMMEPSTSGQALAIERAYSEAGYKISDVDFIEGHGTGTAKGDRVELEAIASTIEVCSSKRKDSSYGITSFKSIVGHTKAAAGVGGFIKAVLAVNQRVLPPTAGCQNPNDVFRGKGKRLYPIINGESLPKTRVVRAGVSSAGFGGINCHIAISSMGEPSEKIKPSIESRSLFASAQDTEIFVSSARTTSHLRRAVSRFKNDLRHISVAEMTDLAAFLGENVKQDSPIKCAIVADSPEHFYEALTVLEKGLESISLAEGETQSFRISDQPGTHIVVGNTNKEARVGFRYPKFVAQNLGMTRRLTERFKWARELVELPKLGQVQNEYRGMISSFLVWTNYLSRLGIRASAVGGDGLHSFASFYKTEGKGIAETVDFGDYLKHQLSARLNLSAVSPSIPADCDILIEVGPSATSRNTKTDYKNSDYLDCFPIDSTSSSVTNMNVALSELFVRGVHINWSELYKNRLAKTFILPSRRKFIQNQCENPLKAVEGEKAVPVQIGVRGEVVVGSSNGSKEQQGGRADADEKIIVEDNGDLTALLVNLAAKMTGFDRNSISLESRLLDDLNLDSIKAGELISESAKIFGVAGEVDPSDLLNESLNQISDRLRTLRDQQRLTKTHPKTVVSGYFTKETWVRDFVIEYKRKQHVAQNVARLKEIRRIAVLSDVVGGQVARELANHLSVNRTTVDDLSYWKTDQKQLSRLADADSIVILLPEHEEHEQLTADELKKTIKRFHGALSMSLQSSMVKGLSVIFVQYGGGNFGESADFLSVESCCAKALGSTLHLERPDLNVRIIDFAPRSPASEVAHKIVAELQTSEKFAAVGYDRSLERQIPLSKKIEPVHCRKRDIQWSEKDVVLVTGGGKGITAECALEFARWTKVQLVLVGRSSVGAGAGGQGNEVANTLQRFKQERLKCEYYQCDITNSDSVREMIQSIHNRFGKITGVIHGAGLNSLRRLKQDTPEEIYTESLPKVVGLLNILNALEKHPPSLVVALTSVIAVTGMDSSGWYGFANEVLNLFLTKYHKTHKETQVQTLAYSVWDEIGMGVRLGSIQRLGQKGVAAIPVSEGVRHFRQLIEHDPGTQQVVVTGRLADLDTWPLPSSWQPIEDLPFMEEIEYLFPNVELIARARLNIRDDPYLLDHNWKGSLLLPFVFGLEVMTQAVVCVIGKNKIRRLKVTDIDLRKPIPVNPETGTNIGIYAKVLPVDNGQKQEATKVKVEISSEQENYQQPHFSGVFEVDPNPEPELVPNNLRDEVRNADLGLNVPRDIYESLLFQGKMFHRIKQIHTLHYDDYRKRGNCTLTSTYHKTVEGVARGGTGKHPSFFTGDPFFIDSMFQSMQLMVAQDSCIPREIEVIELEIGGDDKKQRDCLISSNIRKISGEYYKADSWVSEGHLSLKMTGCRLKILGTNPNNPRASDLIDPSKRDQKIIEESISRITEELKIKHPIIKYRFIPALVGLKKNKRHQIESPVLKNAVLKVLSSEKYRVGQHKIKIGWLASGQPTVRGLRGKDIGISVSHAEGSLVCVAGRGNQGCDIETITERDGVSWKALLGQKYSGLLEELQNYFDDMNFCGTIIWSAIEVFRKVKNIKPDLELEHTGRDWVTLKTSNSTGIVIATKIKLTRSRTSVIALYLESGAVSGLPTSTSESRSSNGSLLKQFGFDENAFGIRVDYSGPQGQYVFTKQYPVTFKTNKLRSRRVYFTTYFDWMGELREYSIHPIMDKLAEMLETGGWGLATNSVKLDILGELRGNDLVTGRVWMEDSGAGSNSIFDICYEWRKRISQSQYERTAFCRQRVSWIKITGHGQGSVEKLPASIETFMNSMRPRKKQVLPLERLDEPLKQLTIGEELRRFNRKHLMDYTFDTSLENSNLVGNVYFSNYARWLGTVGDLYFYRLIPEHYMGSGADGEFICVSCDVDHLREAMPFDQVIVKMHLKTLYRNGVDLNYDFYVKRGSETLKKLAVAQQRLIWVKRSHNKTESKRLPSQITDRFMKQVVNVEQESTSVLG